MATKDKLVSLEVLKATTQADVNDLKSAVDIGEAANGIYRVKLTKNSKYPYFELPLNLVVGDVLHVEVLAYSGDASNVDSFYIYNTSSSSTVAGLDFANENTVTLESDVATPRFIVKQTNTVSDELYITVKIYKEGDGSLQDVADNLNSLETNVQTNKNLITDLQTRAYIAKLSTLGTDYKTALYLEPGDTFTVRSMDGSAMTVTAIYFLNASGTQEAYYGLSGQGVSRTATIASNKNKIYTCYISGGTAQDLLITNDTKLGLIEQPIYKYARAVTAGTTLNQTGIPLDAEDGDVIGLTIENPSLIKQFTMAYTANGSEVSEVLKFSTDAYNTGYFRISGTFTVNSLHFYVAGSNIVTSGTLRIKYWNATKRGDLVQPRDYNSFSVLGDSFSAYKGTIYPDTNAYWYPPSDPTAEGSGSGNDVSSPWDMWWHQFARNNHIHPDKIAAYSGSNVTNGNGATKPSFLARKEDIGNPDVLFIFGGTNDQWNSVPIGDYKYSAWTEDDKEYFAPALAYLLDYYLSNHPGMDIYYILNDNLNSDYKTAINTVCAHYNVPVIKPVIDKTYNHPNKAGMTAIKNTATSAVVTMQYPYYVNR